MAQQAASGSKEQRNAAIRKLGENGAEARPAAYVLCEAILNRETRESALLALEKVHPALYKPVVALVVDQNPWNHQQASQTIAKMEEEGAAAVPVLVWHLLLASELKDKSHPFYNSIENLVGEDLTTLSLIAPREKPVVGLLLKHTKFNLPDGKPGVAVRQRAIDGLGRIAVQYPQYRDVIVHAILDGFLDPHLQKNALAAAACCSTRSEPLKPVLQKLKLNPDATVRDAADAALKEIEMRVEFVPQLEKAGIVEGQIPHPLFEWVYGIVSGKTEITTALPTLTKWPNADLYELYVYLCLCGLPDSPGRKQIAVRRMGIEKASPFTDKYPRFRKYIAPILAAALPDPDCRRLAMDGLLKCGPEAVKALKAATNPAAKAMLSNLETQLRERWNNLASEYDQEAVLLMLGELDSISEETVRLFLMVLQQAERSEQYRSNGRLAAKLLVKFGLKDLTLTEEIFRLIRNNRVKDEETIRLLKQACAALQINIDSDFTLRASILLHPETDPSFRFPAAEWMYSNYPQIKAQVEQDPKLRNRFRETLTAMALNQEFAGKAHDKRVGKRTYQLRQRREFALFLAAEFGPEAQAVAPVFVSWLDALYEQRATFDEGKKALQALESIGPAAAPVARKSIEILSKEPPKRLAPHQQQEMRELSKRILQKWDAAQ